MRNTIITVVSIIGLLGVGAFIFAGSFFGNLFLRPNRQEVVKNPSDYGMDYEDVTVRTEDGVDLAAWLIPGNNGKVIIMGHPGTFTKYGYSLNNETMMRSGYEKDVEFLPSIKHLADAGYTVLMYDQRNHGESGSTPNGQPHDLPANVYKDTLAVAKYMSEHPDYRGQDIGLYGICQNSMINMIAMSKDPEALEEANVKAMTVIQPHGIDSWFENVGIPGPVINLADWFHERRGATRMAEWDPVPFAEDVRVPVLFVQNVNDSTSDMKHVEAIYNAIPSEKNAIWIDEEGTDAGTYHRFHTYNWFNDHPEQLVAFFDAKLGVER